MIVEKRKITGNYTRGTCNFCDKGELSKNQTGLVYPYEEVICFYGTLEVRMCKTCFEKLKSINFDDLKLVENEMNRNEISL
jgi:hypothetical protein